jgi:hypothetical protein
MFKVIQYNLYNSNTTQSGEIVELLILAAAIGGAAFGAFRLTPRDKDTDIKTDYPNW